ncbi:hypothetical protein [Iningainema tapete]|uniref:Uncharacterized protein n=1 Tax=Iningainema tapete BLCC-T55 TaxID=2748662 RepID=A0A8J7CGI0_9CYAN|nr:hypothetical protein [Iningainema tapete]MBD2776385.1 hypothetical protein [Iningainema tapete BLCC-T55]
MTVNLGGGRLFSHFTDANGIKGITGIDSDNLEVGEQVIVTELRFAQGINSFLASEPGRIFVTLLGTDATDSQLMNIGVFGDKQKFVIQFSEETAFVFNGIRILGEVPSRSIFSIPGGTNLKGEFLVTRVRL